MWTREKPSRLVFQRTVKLAQLSYSLFTNSLLPLQKWTSEIENPEIPLLITWEKIFSASLNDYDILIWLNPENLPNLDFDGINSKIGGSPPELFKKVSKTSKSVISKKKMVKIYKNVSDNIHGSLFVDYDPGRIYFRELETRFKDIALFFYDPCGHVIGIMWQPPAYLMSKFQLQKSVHTMPITNNEACGVLPNIFSILNDFKNLGEGVILKIEVVKKQ